MKSIHLLIPMSGQGTRYRKAGFREPKPLIPVSGVPMIERLLARFPTEWPIHFVMAENHRATGLPEILGELRPDGIRSFVPPHDLGPGRAILAGLAHIPEDAPVLVSYCDYDMGWDPAHFAAFVRDSACDACLISYRGFHAHYLSPTTYAYSRLEGERVVEVREKGSFTADREDEYASGGAYYFRSAKLLREALEFQAKEDLRLNGESYTSLTVEALIRLLRKRGEAPNVRVFEVPSFFQWGTPEDLAKFEFWEKSYRAALRFDPAENAVTQVLLPMAGLGSRFREITPIPKAFIPIAGRPMFREALDSLPRPEKTLGIVALVEHAEELRKNAPTGTVLTELGRTPAGQALSVEAGLDTLDPDAEVLVSACDHGVVLDPEVWRAFRARPDADAAIFAIRGFPGADRRPNAFAYVQTEDASSHPFPGVTSVSVKKPLSAKPSADPLLVGTFWFRSVRILREAIAELKRRNIRVNGELYLDSVFDLMKETGAVTRMIPLSGYMNWGDPDSLAEALYWREIFFGRKIERRPRFPGIPVTGKARS